MKAAFFRSNRERMIERLGGGSFVLTAYSQQQRSNDMSFRFEQEANFWWLSGIESPDWWLIVDGVRAKSWLVAPVVSEMHQIFDGSLDAETAQQISGVDEVLTRDKGLEMLRDMARRHSVVRALGEPPHAEYFDFALNPAPKKLYEQLSRIFGSVQDCRKELAQLRAIKTDEEVVAIKKAIDLTTKTFSDIHGRLDQFTAEYEIEAAFSAQFRQTGAPGHAYDPIVAAGKNACTLHYIDNAAKLKKRSLVLLDVGARVDGYAADITRTFAYGEPTKRQQQVHTTVVGAHRKIINLLGPQLGIAEYQQQVDRIMQDALIELGLMQTRDDEKAFRRYFPHAISHGLGVDVHDSLGSPSLFQPGMVLTVEPGIYIPEEAIGVRIEDDILITETGHKNLSGRLSTDW